MRSTRTQLCTAAEAVPAAGRSVNATAASAAPNLGRHTAPRRRLNVRHACTATCSAHPSNVATPSACAPAMAVAPINPTMYATTAADMTRLLNAGLAAGRRNSPLAESTPKHTPSGPNRSTAYVMARSMSAPSSCVGTCASPGGSAWTSAGARASVISVAGAVQSSAAVAAGCVTSTAGGACSGACEPRRERVDERGRESERHQRGGRGAEQHSSGGGLRDFHSRRRMRRRRRRARRRRA